MVYKFCIIYSSAHTLSKWCHTEDRRKVYGKFEIINFNHWDNGYVPLHKLKIIVVDLTTNVEYIFIKGRQRAYLRNLTPRPVIQFEEQSAIKENEAKCIYHIIKGKYICALLNV